MDLNIIKQRSTTGCLAACVETALKYVGISSPDQEEIHKNIMIPKDLVPTGFNLMESAAKYLKTHLKENEVRLYGNIEVKVDRIREFTGIEYLKAVGSDIDFKINPQEFNAYKKKEWETSKNSGVLVHDGGFTLEMLENHIGSHLIILGINVGPIQKHFGVDHPPYGHAVLPFQVKGSNMTFGDPDPAVPDKVTVPKEVLYDSMKANGANFESGNTEAIIIYS